MGPSLCSLRYWKQQMPSKYKRKSQIRDPFKRVIIAMEGNRTEPAYFEEIKRRYKASTLNIVLLTRSPADTRSAPMHVIEQLSRYKQQNKVKQTDELWLVIDKDRWPEQQLSEVAAKCSTNRYELGLSNPCFEIWLVLHYEDLSALSETEKVSLCSSKHTKARWAETKNREKIETFVQLTARINTAVVNAEKLDTDTSERWPNTLGSHVYKLAESILKIT